MDTSEIVSNASTAWSASDYTLLGLCVVGGLFAVAYSLGILEKYLTYFQTKAAAAVDAETKDRYNLLQRLLTFVQGAVTEVYVSYTRERKKANEDGKLTTEEKNAALNNAVAIVVEKAQSEGLDIIKAGGVAFIKYLIERTITANKSAAAVSSVNTVVVSDTTTKTSESVEATESVEGTVTGADATVG